MAKIKKNSFKHGGDQRGAWWSAVFVTDDGRVLDAGGGDGRRYDLPPLEAENDEHHSPKAGAALANAKTSDDVRAAIDIDVARVLAHYTAQE